jgi:autotransporter-associated beta strand protein
MENVLTNSSNTVTGNGGAAGVGSDLFAVSGATLAFAPLLNTTVTFAGSIADDSPFSLPGTGYTTGTGTGPSIIVNGPGTVVFLGSNTYTGSTIINGGILQLSGSGSISNTPITLAGTGIFNIIPLTNGGTTITDLSGSGYQTQVTLGNNTLTLGTSNSTLYTGCISGTGGITKQGSGTLTLDRTNTYKAATTINEGIISVSDDNNLGNSLSPLFMNGGSVQTTFPVTSPRAVTLGSNGGTFIPLSGSLTLTGSISGTGSLILNGSDTLILTHTNTYSGGTAILSGTISISSDSNLGDSAGSLFINGAGLETTAPVTLGRDISLGGNAAAFLTTGGTLTLTGTISGGGDLILAGSGTVILASTNNNYTGTTTINGGTLSVS